MDKNFETSLERLLANWPIEEKRLPGLSVEMYKIFQEVGAERFAAGVDSIIRDNPYKLFPTAAELRGYIPRPTEDETKKQRYIPFKEKHEFQRFVYEINYLNERAHKYPEDAVRCHFQRSRIAGIFHAWLNQHPVCVPDLPDHLTWVIEESEMRKYLANSPDPKDVKCTPKAS